MILGLSSGTVIVVIVIALIVFLSNISTIVLRRKATSVGIKIEFGMFLGMKLRKVDPKKIVHPIIRTKKAGFDLSINMLECHHLAGGDVDRVVQILIDAKKSDLEFSIRRACVIDLEGYDFPTYIQEVRSSYTS